MSFEHNINEQVLVKWQDQRIYYATIRKIDRSRKRCVVEFEGSKRGTASFSQINAVDAIIPDNNWLACIICKFGNSDAPNEIVLCDKCNVAFHQECHKPPISSKVVADPSYPWSCRYCKNGMENPHLNVASEEEEAGSNETGSRGDLESTSNASSSAESSDDLALSERRVAKKRKRAQSLPVVTEVSGEPLRKRKRLRSVAGGTGASLASGNHANDSGPGTRREAAKGEVTTPTVHADVAAGYMSYKTKLLSNASSSSPPPPAPTTTTAPAAAAAAATKSTRLSTSARSSPTAPSQDIDVAHTAAAHKKKKKKKKKRRPDESALGKPGKDGRQVADGDSGHAHRHAGDSGQARHPQPAQANQAATGQAPGRRGSHGNGGGSQQADVQSDPLRPAVVLPQVGHILAMSRVPVSSTAGTSNFQYILPKTNGAAAAVLLAAHRRAGTGSAFRKIAPKVDAGVAPISRDTSKPAASAVSTQSPKHPAATSSAPAVVTGDTPVTPPPTNPLQHMVAGQLVKRSEKHETTAAATTASKTFMAKGKSSFTSATRPVYSCPVAWPKSSPLATAAVRSAVAVQGQPSQRSGPPSSGASATVPVTRQLPDIPATASTAAAHPVYSHSPERSASASPRPPSLSSPPPLPASAASTGSSACGSSRSSPRTSGLWANESLRSSPRTPGNWPNEAIISSSPLLVSLMPPVSAQAATAPGQARQLLAMATTGQSLTTVSTGSLAAKTGGGRSDRPRHASMPAQIDLTTGSGRGPPAPTRPASRPRSSTVSTVTAADSRSAQRHVAYLCDAGRDGMLRRSYLQSLFDRYHANFVKTLRPSPKLLNSSGKFPSLVPGRAPRPSASQGKVSTVLGKPNTSSARSHGSTLRGNMPNMSRHAVTATRKAVPVANTTSSSSTTAAAPATAVAGPASNVQRVWPHRPSSSMTSASQHTGSSHAGARQHAVAPALAKSQSYAPSAHGADAAVRSPPPGVVRIHTPPSARAVVMLGGGVPAHANPASSSQRINLARHRPILPGPAAGGRLPQPGGYQQQPRPVPIHTQESLQLQVKQVLQQHLAGVTAGGGHRGHRSTSSPAVQTIGQSSPSPSAKGGVNPLADPAFLARIMQTCIGCRKPAHLVCSICEKVWYCSTECQEKYYSLRCMNCTVRQ